MEEILRGLNEGQRQAVLDTGGACLVVAGAGSGKTRVLTMRIAHMIRNQNIDSFRILALTFTNKAAAEMRHRIESLVGTEAKNIWMGTFHSVFARILRYEADRLNYPKNFTIYDTDDSRSLLRTVIKEMGLDDKVYKPNSVHARISSAKNKLISFTEYNNNPAIREQDIMSRVPEMARIYQAYQTRMFKAGAMDFDDLLFQTNVLFRDHIDVLNKYQQKFHYVLVDEYQDTNLAQYLIIRKLAAVRQNVCVVGDDAQSIYSFRGADISNILNFSKDYPEHKIYRLEQNYRSTKNIVGIANSVIKHNRNQIKKNVWTSNEDGDKVDLIKATSDNEEAKLVATDIFEERMNKGLRFQDFAILYRTNAQSRSLEEALRRMNIRYKIYGGLSFYSRKEIKDLIGYLRFIVNPADEEAFKRIINYPKRGIGDTSVAKMVVAAADHGMPVWEVARNARQFLDGRAASQVETFSTLVQAFMLAAEAKDAYEVASQVAKETGILRELYEDKTVEGLSRYENVQELLNAIKAYVDDQENEDKSIASFLQLVSLATDADDKDKANEDAVTLMTVHSAKGLEFKHVFIVGIEEDLFPSQMALGEREGLEEERRLFYVACTRAEHKLTLSYAMSRYRYGQLKPCEPSRFLEEVDQSHLQVTRRYEGANSEAPQPLRFFDQFKERSGKKDVKVGLKSAPGKPAPGYKPSGDFVAADAGAIQAGQRVEHQKFGFGKVLLVDSSSPNLKATVAFEEVGEKTLVLNFAKLMIHEG